MNSKEKIIFLIADITYVGGIERVNTLLANGFIDNGYDIEIISLYKSNQNINYPLSERVSISYINEINYSGRPGSIFRLIKHLFCFRKLNSHLRKLKAKHIIVNSFPMAILAFPSKFFSKSNYIVIEHVHAFYYNKILRILRSFIYKSYNSIVTLTEQDKLFYSKNHSSVYKIENPLSFNVYTKANLASNKIIAVGRLEKQKGFDLLIEAYSRIDKQIRNNWILNIYGQGGEINYLQELINTYNLNEEVYLKGIVNNISEFYNQHSIFAFSSRFEGFGMALVEAMNSGLPCISFDCPAGPRDILLNGEAGILIENGDIDSFSSSLAKLMLEEDLRYNFAKKSIARSHDFELNVIIEKWKKLFNNLN